MNMGMGPSVMVQTIAFHPIMTIKWYDVFVSPSGGLGKTVCRYPMAFSLLDRMRAKNEGIGWPEIRQTILTGFGSSSYNRLD